MRRDAIIPICSNPVDLRLLHEGCHYDGSLSLCKRRLILEGGVLHNDDARHASASYSVIKKASPIVRVRWNLIRPYHGHPVELSILRLMYCHRKPATGAPPSELSCRRHLSIENLNDGSIRKRCDPPRVPHAFQHRKRRRSRWNVRKRCEYRVGFRECVHLATEDQFAKASRAILPAGLPSNRGSSGSRVGVLGNFRGLEACM
jgi:hypothetical protein